MKKIMFYGLNNDRQSEIIPKLKELNLGLIDLVEFKNIKHSLGPLFETEEIDAKDEKEYTQEQFAGREFMMIKGLNSEEVGELLAFFRKNEIKRPIACGLTENNFTWSLGELFEELIQEDEYMKKFPPVRG